MPVWRVAAAPVRHGGVYQILQPVFASAPTRHSGGGGEAAGGARRAPHAVTSRRGGGGSQAAAASGGAAAGGMARLSSLRFALALLRRKTQRRQLPACRSLSSKTPRLAAAAARTREKREIRQQAVTLYAGAASLCMARRRRQCS